jgi:hypothetical protein
MLNLMLPLGWQLATAAMIVYAMSHSRSLQPKGLLEHFAPVALLPVLGNWFDLATPLQLPHLGIQLSVCASPKPLTAKAGS